MLPLVEITCTRGPVTTLRVTSPLKESTSTWPSCTLVSVTGPFRVFTCTWAPVMSRISLAAAGLSCLLKGRGLWLAGGALVAGLAVLAALRAQVFVNEEALWQD